jgi:hypothetical protein
MTRRRLVKAASDADTTLGRRVPREPVVRRVLSRIRRVLSRIRDAIIRK